MERVLNDLATLPSSEVRRVRDEATRLLAQEALRSSSELAGATELPGHIIRPVPPDGHPGGSLDRDDPLFTILSRLAEDRHQSVPSEPVRLEL